MEEGRIVLVGNETDILHCGYTYPLSEGGKRYPSAEHYAHSMILTQLGLDEVHILELLATASGHVPLRARELLMENMPAGHDMASLAQYLTTSRQSYTMLGLRLRAEQDKRFRHALMETNDALLVVCDRHDSELGVGMDEEEFVAYTRRMRANAERISQWMRDERTRPRELGQNQLGFFLMWLRFEIRERERAKWMSTVEMRVPGISLREAADEEREPRPVKISTSDFVVSLQGIFQPLSNYYAHVFEMRGEQYRSVEHYAYQRLFEAMKLSALEVQKIRTTVRPVDVAKMATKLFKVLGIEEAVMSHKVARLDRWRQSAMKHKISKSDYLQKLLLATGHALVLECADGGDPHWCCGSDEFELQHLLTKKYITAQLLVDWMSGREQPPSVMSHLGGNKAGLLLMELRARFASQTTHRIPLVAPLTSSMLRATVSNHMVCFTAESVLHPFHPVEIHARDSKEAFPSPIHFVAQVAIKFFNISRDHSDWIMEPAATSLECWERLHHVLCEQLQPPLERLQQWYMDERQRALKAAMQLQFEQHPQLLRVLLETADALLVYCARFSTTEAELSIGMRERDLRLWLSQVRIDTKQLIDVCLRPMAFRPPYMGGNRFGLLLMEVRREFVLKGLTAQQLPEMPGGMPVDGMLGSDSPLENYLPHMGGFDVFDEWNYRALWANAFLLMAKQDSMPEDLWEKAISVKRPPALLTTDETQISQLYTRLTTATSLSPSQLQQSSSFPPIAELLHEPYPEVVRAVYARMRSHMLERLSEDDDVQKLLGQKSKETNRFLDIRHTAEQILQRDYQQQQQQGSSGGGAGGDPAMQLMRDLPQQPQPPPNSSLLPPSQMNQPPSGHPPQPMGQWGGGPHQQRPHHHQRERSPPPPPLPPHHHAPPPGMGGMQQPQGKIPSLLADMTAEPPRGYTPPPARERERERRLPLPPARQPSHMPLSRSQQGGASSSSRYPPTAGRRSPSLSPPVHRLPASTTRRPFSPVRFGGVRVASARSTDRAPTTNSTTRRNGGQGPPTTGDKDARGEEEGEPEEGEIRAGRGDGGPPLAKRPKKQVDESELSEGEILSDEEEDE